MDPKFLKQFEKVLTKALARQMERLDSIEENMATKADAHNFATKDDLKQYANKDDLRKFATKDDLKPFATKDDLKNFATKDDLKPFATKDDLKNFATRDQLDGLFDKLREDITADIVEVNTELINHLDEKKADKTQVALIDTRVAHLERKISV